MGKIKKLHKKKSVVEFISSFVVLFLFCRRKGEGELETKVAF